MRLSDLRPCNGCGKGLGLHFFRVEVQQHFVNVGEARKRHAMDVMFPGAPGLAATMTGDPDNGTIPVQTCALLLCTDCFCGDSLVASLWEKAGAEEDAATAAEHRA